MYDVITFGSATKDIFIKIKNPKIIKDEKNTIVGKEFCFNLDSKTDVEEMLFYSGGGGTNTAATFAKQGLKVAYCGAIGNDLAGQEIIQELKKIGVDTKFVVKKEKPTNHSIIFLSSEGEKTIFSYRGASGELEEKDIPLQKLKAKWFYLAPLSGSLCEKFSEIVDFAHQNNIKVALNPGNCQLNLPFEKLEKILKKADVLFLNLQEASLLTKIPYQEEEEIFKKMYEICGGIVVIGTSKYERISDGKYTYTLNLPQSKVVDKTGGGDAMASGFVTGLIEKGDIEYAAQLGMANSLSCLENIGAKTGLLKKGEKFNKVEIEKNIVRQ